MKYTLLALMVTVAYMGINIYFLNFDLVNSTILGEYPASYKTTVLSEIVIGFGQSLPVVDYTVMVLIALFTGLNVALLVKKISMIRSLGRVHIVFGGGSVLGLVAGGCAACGLPVLSLLGLSGALGALPLNGSEFSYLALVLLAISTIVLVKVDSAVVCDVPKQRSASKTKKNR
jgi:hypothetical protein